MKEEKDKFKAIWLSHSSIADFLKCPRLYFLRNVYKNPKNNHKFTIITPHLALGSAVHEVVESLSQMPTEERLANPLSEKFETAWQKVHGELGGFINNEQELQFKKRGLNMLNTITSHPGPILKKAVKIKTEDGLPYFWFTPVDNVILCGKIDWIEYLPKNNSVHIIDFKTGRHEEDDSSLQMPIYLLLVTNTQKRKVTKASYWYLDKDTKPKTKKLPSLEESMEQVEKVAQRIKLARQLKHFVCPDGGCKYCLPYEEVLKGNGKKVGISSYGQDIYILEN